MSKSILNIVRVGITECDMFSAGISIRYKKDDNFKTLTSGCCSLMLILMLTMLFAASFMSYLKKQNVRLSELSHQASDPTELIISTENFLFAFGLNKINMSSSVRYFDFKVTVTEVVNGKKKYTPLQIQPCTIEQWAKFGQEVADSYHKINLDSWLCPTPNQVFSIQGKYTSNFFKYLKISASACTGIDCYSSTDIAEYLKVNGYFSLNFYYTSSTLNFDLEQPLGRYLEDTHSFIFSPEMGVSTNVYLTNYEIISDDNIVLWQSIGGVGSFSVVRSTDIIENSYFKPLEGEFLKIYLRKSPETKTIQRSYLKLDELLSNLGGLFSIAFMLFQLPLYYYNSYCYQLSLASDLFKYHRNQDASQNSNTQMNDASKQGQQWNTRRKGKVMNLTWRNSNARKTELEQKHDKNMELPSESAETIFQRLSKNFNFIVYLVYLPFVLLRKFGCKPAWKYFTALWETMMEIRKMTDMRRMMQRFIYTDRVFRVLLNSEQRMLLHLQEKQTIQQIEEERSHYKLYKKMAIQKLKIPVIFIKGSIRTKNHKSQMQNQCHNGLTKQQFEVVQSYLKLREHSDVFSREIVKGIDKDILRSIMFQLKKQQDKERRKKMLAFNINGNTPRSNEISEIVYPMNSGTKLQQINLDDTNAGKLYQFEDDVPPLTRRNQSTS